MKFANIVNCIYKEYKEPDHNEEGTELEEEEQEDSDRRNYYYDNNQVFCSVCLSYFIT
jgi:hypothetical protein